MTVVGAIERAARSSGAEYEVATARSRRADDLDVAQLSMSGMSIAMLASVYMRWESRRGPATVQYLVEGALWDGQRSIAKAVSAAEDLFKYGLIALNGNNAPGKSGNLREVEITPDGIRWFEANCDYRRECNVVSYKSRFGSAGIFEYDTRLTLWRRLRDPLVPAAALFGAALSLLILWLIR